MAKENVGRGVQGPGHALPPRNFGYLGAYITSGATSSHYSSITTYFRFHMSVSIPIKSTKSPGGGGGVILPLPPQCNPGYWTTSWVIHVSISTTPGLNIINIMQVTTSWVIAERLRNVSQRRLDTTCQ